MGGLLNLEAIRAKKFWNPRQNTELLTFGSPVCVPSLLLPRLLGDVILDAKGREYEDRHARYIA